MAIDFPTSPTVGETYTFNGREYRYDGEKWSIQPSSDFADGSVTYEKIQDVAANSVLARAASTSGVVSAVALAASQLLGRGSTGDVAAISVASGLTISGTELGADIGPNMIINGDGQINQRFATSQADDTYAWDRHYVLTQTGAVGISTVDGGDGAPYMMRLTQSQASAQRMGVATILEARDSTVARGGPITLSGKLESSTAQTIRYAILEWTGTADSVTSDVVLDWTSGTYTAGNFFLASNLTVAATGSLALSATTLTDFELTASISSSCNNLIFFVWTDATAAQNVTLDVRWQAEQGATATPWHPRRYSVELIRCQRYLFPLADGRRTGIEEVLPSFGVKRNNTRVSCPFGYFGMRTVPTLVDSNPAWVASATSGNEASAYNYKANAYASITGGITYLIQYIGKNSLWFSAQAGTTLSGTNGDIHLFLVGSSAYFHLDAEL